MFSVLAFYVRMGRQRAVRFTANCQYENGLLGWSDGFSLVSFSLLTVVGGLSVEAVGVTHWEEKMNRATGLILLFCGRLKMFSVGLGKRRGRQSPCVVNDDVYDFPTRNRKSLDLIALAAPFVCFSLLILVIIFFDYWHLMVMQSAWIVAFRRRPFWFGLSG